MRQMISQIIGPVGKARIVPAKKKKSVPAVYTLFLVLILFPADLIAQQQNDLEFRSVRVTLLPGLSSNGVDAANYTARYSLNLLAGYHGGVDGYEIGLINVNERYARGFQAGALNISGGGMSGISLAGAANYSRRDMRGVQLAVFANVSEQSLEGFQATGFVNSGIRSIRGLQIAGIGNIARRDLQGAQLAGVFNSSVEGSQGLMLAGFGNFSAGRAQGFMISGGINVARDMQTLSFAGFLNATRRMQGFQVSGLANVARRVQGVQIGLINYARDFEGIPVGLVSYYGNGRKNIDTWMSDAGFQHMGIKLGTTSVYNMVSFGYNPFLKEREVWSLGWTIGSYTPLDEAWNHSRYEGYFRKRDFSIQNIQEGKLHTRINSIYSYRYLLGKDLTGGFGIYAGPSLNILISREARSHEYTWYSILSGERGGSDFAFWLGFSIGLQFFGHESGI
jgi:hypothetical protein